MASVVFSLVHSLRFMVRARISLHLEIIALRHQLAVVNRSRRPHLRFTPLDRMLWAWLSRSWRGWRSALHIVKPETVLAWHRRGFRLFWTWKSRHRTGRPAVPHDVRLFVRRGKNRTSEDFFRRLTPFHRRSQRKARPCEVRNLP